MKHLLYIAIAFVFLSACSSQGTPEEEAAKAAQSYYMLLADSMPEAFLNARVGADRLPEIYRAQMQKVYEQYICEVNAKHGGIREVRISNNVARHDSAQHLTYAFLMLCFGDSTQEEVMVPMVEVDGKWLMK